MEALAPTASGRPHSHGKASLDGLKEGSDLTLRVSPKEGSPFEIVACHTFNPEQIEWFKAGSALNAMKAKMSAAPKKVEAFPVGA